MNHWLFKSEPNVFSFDMLKKKGKAGAMPGYARAFSDGQIIAILAYIRGLDDSGG